MRKQGTTSKNSQGQQRTKQGNLDASCHLFGLSNQAEANPHTSGLCTEAGVLLPVQEEKEQGREEILQIFFSGMFQPQKRKQLIKIPTATS